MTVILKYTNDLYVGDMTDASDAASKEDVLQQIDSMPWQTLSMVEMENSEGVKLEASGSHEDGFSMTYTVSPKSYITKEGPTLDEVKAVAALFVDGDPAWQTVVAFEYWQNEDGSLDPGEGEYASGSTGNKGCLGVIGIGLIVGLGLLL